MKHPADVIDEAVRRIVAEAHPLRAVIFGSTARGESGQDSDLNLLVVVSDNANRLETAYALHKCLRGLGCAKDIVVVLENQVTAFQDNPYMIVHTARTEGREVYQVA